MTGPDGQPVEVESNNTVLVHGVDESGNYLGLVEMVEAHEAVGCAPPQPHSDYVWGGVRWQRRFTLTDAKVSHWTLMKQRRDEVEFGTFTWDGSVFDCNREAQARIMGVVQMATLAMAASQPFSMTWTLADNSTRELSGEDMVAVGLALGTHVATAHAIGRLLRSAIEAATTFQEVGDVQWP